MGDLKVSPRGGKLLEVLRENHTSKNATITQANLFSQNNPIYLSRNSHPPSSFKFNQQIKAILSENLLRLKSDIQNHKPFENQAIDHSSFL